MPTLKNLYYQEVRFVVALLGLTGLVSFIAFGILCPFVDTDYTLQCIVCSMEGFVLFIVCGNIIKIIKNRKAEL